MPALRCFPRRPFRIALGILFLSALFPVPSRADRLPPLRFGGEGVCADLGRGFFHSVDEAIRGGLDINAADPKDVSLRPPLVCAAEEGLDEAVRFLLDRKADTETEARGLRGRRTALHAAAAGGHDGIVRMLLDAGAAVDARDAMGRTPLLHAAFGQDKRKSERYAAAAGALLEKGADPEARDGRGETALTLAAGNRNPETVALLVSRGAGGNVRNGNGRTPLMLAAEAGDPAMVETLLAAKVRLEDRDGLGKTAWCLAAEKAHRPVMDRLRAAGAVERYGAVDPVETFRNAACGGDVPLMRQMAKRGVNARSRKGPARTAIVLAADCGQEDSVRYLLGNGADPNARDGEGRTALIAAFEDFSGTGREAAAREEIARLLIARGARVNARDGRGETALVRAVRWDNPGGVSLLLSKGARTDVADAAGTPALVLAAKDGDTEATRALLEARADTGARDREGKTAMTRAVEGGHRAVAALLAKAGAYPEYATMEWEGNESDVEEKLEAAVTDREEWRRLWRRAFDKEAPDVDFDRNFVACVFLGHRAGWWYSIRFGNPVEKDGEHVVGYMMAMLRVGLSLEGAREPGFRGQYAMKVFPKKDGFRPVVRLSFKEGGFPMPLVGEPGR